MLRRSQSYWGWKMQDAESLPSRACSPTGGRDWRAISNTEPQENHKHVTASGVGACARGPDGSTHEHPSVSAHVYWLATVTLMIRINNNLNIIQLTHVPLHVLNLHDDRPLRHSSAMSHANKKHHMDIRGSLERGTETSVYEISDCHRKCCNPSTAVSFYFFFLF